MLLMRCHRFNGAYGMFMMIHVHVLGSMLFDCGFSCVDPDRTIYDRELTPGKDYETAQNQQNPRNYLHGCYLSGIREWLPSGGPAKGAGPGPKSPDPQKIESDLSYSITFPLA